MRVSILRDDPGFDPDILSGHARYDIFLDDMPQEGVLIADDEEGVVVAYLRDAEGGWRHANGTLLQGEMRGEVRIVRT